MPAYTEPLHVILDGLKELEKSLMDGRKPWIGYDSAFDIDGILPEPSEGEYRRAIQIAQHYVNLMLDVDLPLDKAFLAGNQYR